jgi:pimeloyl-ACP methyl ester carboxylesterase
MKKILLLIMLLTINHNLRADGTDTAVFDETNITLTTATGDIFGTLMLPAKNDAPPPDPVALIIAGSGPTDRNGNNPAMKNDSLKLLAQALSKRGIASLRYDKRAIAASAAAAKSEADLRFENYIDDAKGWVALLKADRRFSKVTVIGHSEGSLIGMVAAATADQYVSIAGVGRPADETLKIQLQAQPKSVQDLCFPIIDSLKNGRLVSDVNPALAALFRPSVQPYLISWFRYDPQTEIKKLKVPVLIVQGTGDIQVSVDDAQRLAAAYPQAQLVLIEHMNHIFRLVEGDRQANLATYSDATLPIAAKLPAAVADFILKPQNQGKD